MLFFLKNKKFYLSKKYILFLTKMDFILFLKAILCYSTFWKSEVYIFERYITQRCRHMILRTQVDSCGRPILK